MHRGSALKGQVANLGDDRVSAPQVARETIQRPTRIVEIIHHVLGVILRNMHPEILHIQLRNYCAQAADMIVVRVSADNVFDGRRAVHRPNVLDDRLPGILKAAVDHD